jgi:mRNA interferase RelE/StbE
MWKLFESKTYTKDKKARPDIRNKVKKAENNIRESPKSGNNIKKLQGLESQYRYRIGEDRLRYKVDEANKAVILTDLKSRGDVYK